MTKMNRGMAQAAAALLLCAGSVSCATSPSAAQGRPVAPMTSETQNTLSAAERQAGWRLLFDGQSTSGWKGYKTATVPSGWRVANGELAKDDATEDILTTEQFGDFELSLDWKIGRGGNAGLFYRGTEEYERIYWSAPEYQLLDDPNARDGASRLTSAGAAYGLYPAPEGALKPAGAWNTTRIVARGSHIEHWLNGSKLLEYELGGADWTAKVKASKFNDWPNYGKARRGHIGIQGDHNGTLALRNVKIRELR